MTHPTSRVVPREPTEEMYRAGNEGALAHVAEYGQMQILHKGYRATWIAMFDAAPDTSPSPTPEPAKRSADALFALIAHGDDKHRQWLRDKCDEFFATTPEPALAVPDDAEWQPMETAPRDGQDVLLRVERRAGIPGRCLVGHWMPGGHCIEDHPPIDRAWYFWNGSMFDIAAKPTHWMPLPEPPKWI